MQHIQRVPVCGVELVLTDVCSCRAGYEMKIMMGHYLFDSASPRAVLTFLLGRWTRSQRWTVLYRFPHLNGKHVLGFNCGRCGESAGQHLAEVKEGRMKGRLYVATPWVWVCRNGHSGHVRRDENDRG